METALTEQISSRFKIARRRVDAEMPYGPAWAAAMGALDELEDRWRFSEPARQEETGEVIAPAQ